MDPARKPAPLDALRARSAAQSPVRDKNLPFGVPALDAALPGGGLAYGALHEVAGLGPEMEHATAATLFVAGALARLCTAESASALWVLHQHDLFAPGLAASGLDPDRVIYAEVPRPADVLLALEDALRHRGLAAVAGEFSGKLSLTASRRLHLAAEKSGIACFLLRRSARHDDPILAAPCAAVTRWRLAALPSPPPLPDRPDVPGFGRARWQVALLRCRGGMPGSWVMEACDAQGRLGVPAEFMHRPSVSDHAGVSVSVPMRRRAGGGLR